MMRQFSRSYARDTEPSPSIRPRAVAMPRLVGASASKPSDASNLAVPASHGFGRIRIPGRACISRNRRPFSACERISSPLPVIAGSDGHHPKAVVVVAGHLIDKVDLPGEVLAHRCLALLTAFARRQHDVFRLARHPSSPRFQPQAGADPRLGAAG